jgi:hypothetical protein
MSLATAMEEEIAGMKRTKLSTRVSRHFQRFGYRVDSFCGHETFSFSPHSFMQNKIDLVPYLMCMKTP